MKQRYLMPKGKDRTDYRRLGGMSEGEINYSDIPPLNDPVWVSPNAPEKVTYHVFPIASGWSVRRSGSDKGIGSFESKAAAVRLARANARKDQSALVVHGRDGSIREFVTFAPEAK